MAPATMADALTDHMCRQLAWRLPEGCRMERTEDGIELDSALRGGRRALVDPTTIDVGVFGDLDDQAALLVERILSAIQDFVAEATTDPWPSPAGTLPKPWANCREGTVSFGFGDDRFGSFQIEVGIDRS